MARLTGLRWGDRTINRGGYMQAGGKVLLARDVQRMSRDAIAVHDMDESRCYRYTLDVQRMNRYTIVVHEMFNGGVEMLSLYMRCSTDESRWHRYTWAV
ncbi:hypothetical protein Tco_1133403 [Tanacetum coccineum]